jgi:arginyl-tRNA synthetase
MNIYNIVRDKVIAVVSQLAKQHKWEDINYQAIVVEIPNDLSHGDVSTNAAMVASKQAKKSPKDLAALIIKKLLIDEVFQDIKVAGGGFINMILHPSYWQKELKVILDKQDKYAKSDIGKGLRVNIEYCSANPTGPLHIGHARGTIYGDALASLLEYIGYSVTREFYVNDAGNQMKKVVESLYIRYMELCGKYHKPYPKDCYPGQYVIDAAKDLKKQYAYQLVDIDEKKRTEIIHEFAIESTMSGVKNSLKLLGTKHDIFFYESLLHKEDKISEVIKFLKKQEVVYKGVLEMPKGAFTTEWEEREQLLFKTTRYGDDVDRPLQKPDGSWTYFAADIAYLQNKLKRGFNKLLLVLGADHTGYQKRMEAACAALNGGENILNTKLCQLVVFLKDGKPFKMSKRMGQFLTVDQVVKIVGKDALRFMMLTRKNDAIMEFDFSKVKEQSKDNPVFYVQYANARGHSVIENAKEQMPEALENIDKADLSLLQDESEMELIRLLSYWPRQVEIAATHYEPHRISFYLQNVAAKFHAFWNRGKGDEDLRFIVKSNSALTTARLTLVQSTIKIISSGLKLMGVTPVKHM